MKTEVLFYRKGHIIRHHADNHVVFTGEFTTKNGKLPSINAAKRQSRKLQDQFGQGCVRVVS